MVDRNVEANDRVDVKAHTESYLLVAQNLQKFYGDKPVLKDLSFSLKPSRIMGFLGPNGAGKTTAMRILTTIIQPSGGKFSVNGIGQDEPDKLRGLIGVLPESNGFPEGITAIEYLTYFGRLYGQTSSYAKNNTQNLLREVGLEKRAKSIVSTYSRGMKQRLGIARALINNPLVLFLDEPTLGLDPLGQRELLLLLKTITRDRKTGIILSSHLLDEVEEVCDDVVILRSGEVVASGTVAEVVQKNLNNHARVNVPDLFVHQAQEILQTVAIVLHVSQAKESSGWLDIEFTDIQTENQQEKDLYRNQLLGALLAAGVPIIHYQAGGGRLQEVFLQLTNERQ